MHGPLFFAFGVVLPMTSGRSNQRISRDLGLNRIPRLASALEVERPLRPVWIFCLSRLLEGWQTEKTGKAEDRTRGQEELEG